MRHDNDMEHPEHSSLGKRGAAYAKQGYLCGRGQKVGGCIPLVEEVPIGVNDIWFRELMLDERDYVREVAFTGVLTVDD